MMYNVVENERHIYMCAVVRVICSEVNLPCEFTQATDACSEVCKHSGVCYFITNYTSSVIL